MALTSVGVVYLVLMMCSRVYLGAHSWNQVVFGASLGFCLAIIGHRNVKPWFYGLCERSLGKNRFNLDFKEVVKMICFLAPFVLASLILLVVRLDQVPTYLEDPYARFDWEIRMANAECSELQITSFPKSTTLGAFTAVHWFTYPVFGLFS